jgi:hypothetical protein
VLSSSILWQLFMYAAAVSATSGSCSGPLRVEEKMAVDGVCPSPRCRADEKRHHEKRSKLGSSK